jgi:hypothetical protein
MDTAELGCKWQLDAALTPHSSVNAACVGHVVWVAAEDYAPGVICFHAKFGDGVIDRVDERAGLVEVLLGGQRRVLALEVCRARQMLRVGSPGGLATARTTWVWRRYPPSKWVCA